MDDATKSGEARSMEVKDRYSIYLEDQDLVAFLSPEVDGFFSDSESSDGYVQFIMRSARLATDSVADILSSPRMLKAPGNIELNLLNMQNKAMGSYFIATPQIRDVQQRTDGNQIRYDLKISGNTIDRHRKFDEYLWATRWSGGPHTKGQWKGLPPRDLEGWLTVCRIAQSSMRTEDSTVSNIILDGREIGTENEFYCALGEAINGPGGYFGFNLDSLEDCFRGGFGTALPTTITWTDSGVSLLRMGEQKFLRIIEVLDRPDVTLYL